MEIRTARRRLAPCLMALAGACGITAHAAAETISFPATFEAEDFDPGGEGAGYHDNVAGNAGGEYRTGEDVDIITTSDWTGAYDVNNFETGEWLAYTVDVAATGSYELELRLSTAFSRSKFRIEIDGRDVTGTVDVPSTGGWTNYMWLSVGAIDLTAGQHRMKIVVEEEYFNLNRIRGTAVAVSSPYSSVPAPLPGRIEAEDFDTGGEGVAYHDNVSGNAGGQYRTDEDVDIIATSDWTGVYDVNNFETGEWLNYTVEVAEAGVYDLALRLATDFTDSAFHIEIDGADVTGRVSVPRTGGWTSYAWVSADGVELPAGRHQLRVVADQQYFNLNSIRATAAPESGPYSGSPVALPGRFEAEDFDLGGDGAAYHDKTAGNSGGAYRPNEDVDIVASSDASGGYNVTKIATGEWLSYTVDVAETGEYDIELRLATKITDSVFHVEVDGVDVTGRIAVPSTKGWTRYEWIGAQGVELTAGQHRLRVIIDRRSFELNSVRVVESAAASGIDPSEIEFSCTFPNSPTDCSFYEQAAEPGRASIVNVARDGTTGVRLHTEPGDTNVSGSGSTAVRNDLMLSQAETGCYEGAEQWWSHSVLFPDDYVVPPDWGVALDFHHTGSTGQANFHVDAASWGLRLRGYGGASVDSGRYEVLLGPAQRNHWYDFVYHVKWSSGSDGFFDAWVDGEQVLAHRGPTLYEGQGCYLKLANYHTATDQASSIIHDRVMRGTTPEAVSIGPLEGVLELVDGVLTPIQ